MELIERAHSTFRVHVEGKGRLKRVGRKKPGRLDQLGVAEWA